MLRADNEKPPADAGTSARGKAAISHFEDNQIISYSEIYCKGVC